jgi:glycosyltransferase involved in cell wall biosynthesis
VRGGVEIAAQFEDIRASNDKLLLAKQLNPTMENNMTRGALSFVIISRNEEQNIERCIGSILDQGLTKAENIILVDSASTDHTVELAARYPVTILQLDPDAELSPSAGRFVGMDRANGEFIQFLDGDMILIEDWLGAALKEMTDPAVGGGGGGGGGGV